MHAAGSDGFLSFCEVAVSGETFLSKFFSVGAWSLSVFDMTPEGHSSLCHGSVKGGVSFGTNGPLQCSIAPHTKQDDTQVNAFYIASV